MTDCIFCKIVARELPATYVFENDQVVAFMDLKPVTKGHLLVVPKIHSTDITETSSEAAAALINQAQILGTAAMNGLNAQGFNIGINTKPAAGQVIFHTHVHVIPRYSHDGLKMWPNMDQLEEDLETTANSIRAQLK